LKVILLAAGLGTRLEPLTSFLPKPMILISGKPILEYIINDLKKSGFTDFCIVIGHLGEKIKKYFGDGSAFNIHISYVEQEIFSGTASATKLARNFVNDTSFLLYLADTIIPKNLTTHLENMINSNYDMSILSSQIMPYQIGNVGNIEVENNNIIKITEKDLNHKSPLGWSGIAFFKNNYIFKIIEKLNPSTRGEFEITDAMNIVLNNNRKIGNFTCEGYVDAGTISGLLELNKIILNQEKITVQNDSKICYPVYVGKRCHIGKNVKLGPFVSIGDDVYIGDNVQLKNSLILNNSKISSNQNISNSVIDDNKNIISLK
tara:strand:+ start:495 stop:1448 length:954 start_codon:yes stop_codon:yes gene_type:complete